MAPPNEKLAFALRELHEKGELRIFTTNDFSRVVRERLVNSGYLTPIIRGWFYQSNPQAAPGDTTQWSASYWDFLKAYCEHRFGQRWTLSAHQSLMIAGGNTSIPEQMTVSSPLGDNNLIKLPLGMSIYVLKSDTREELVTTSALLPDINVLRPAYAMTQVSDSFFAHNPVEASVVLSQIKDASEILRYLIDADASVVAGRLVGAFEHVGRTRVASEIEKTMTAAHYNVRKQDPFTRPVARIEISNKSPLVSRMTALWGSARESVIDAFPPAPGLPGNEADYLSAIDDVFTTDAYHSLSIEGYRVTHELIERIHSGEWDEANNEEDRKSRDAMAARGYWDAFQNVKKAISKIIAGDDPTKLIDDHHREWFRDLFQPSVNAGLVQARNLAGYRNHPIYLNGSNYVPPRQEMVPDGMEALIDLMAAEPEASVRAVLGHWLFGYVHPYPDGNGRVSRFVMNAQLASGGYPWTVIRVEDRSAYLKGLDAASIKGDLTPFASLIADRVMATTYELGLMRP